MTFAYERLINEGYLITRPMVGTYVSAALPEHAMSASTPPDAGIAEMSRIHPGLPPLKAGLTPFSTTAAFRSTSGHSARILAPFR